MATNTQAGGVLTADQLREVDEQMLEYLSDGRVTPLYVRECLAEDIDEYSRGYIQQRLARLAEHGHVENLRGTGLYELVSDPRSAEDGGRDD